MELKVFRVAHHLYKLQSGGAEKLAVQLAKSARTISDGCDFVFYGTKGGGNLEDELRKSEIRYGFPDFDVPQKNRHFASISSAYVTFKHARAFCLKNKVDLLHTHVGHSTELGMLLSWSLKIPFVVTLHSPQIIPLAIKEGSLKWHIRKRLLLMSLKRATHLIAVSEEVSEKALLFAGRAIAKPEVITNGILPPDREQLRPIDDTRAELGIGPETTILIGVGRLVENKGQRVLVEMMADLKARDKSVAKVILLLVGDGPDRLYLEKLAHSLNVEDRIIFLGDRSDVPDLLHSSDVFVSGSRFEGLSLAVLEAMALGKAIVSTPAPGTVEALSNYSGIVCAEHSATSLCDSLADVLGNKEMFTEISQNALKRFEKLYRIDNMTSQYLSTYEHIINEHALL